MPSCHTLSVRRDAQQPLCLHWNPRFPNPRLHAAVCDLGSRLPDLQAAQLRMVKALLAAGADPMARDSSGLTAIHKACYYAAGPEVVRVLLEAGCDPRDRALSHDKSCLEMSANQGHPRWVGHARIIISTQPGAASQDPSGLGLGWAGLGWAGQGGWRCFVVQGGPAMRPACTV